MSEVESEWTLVEQAIAQAAFEKAYEREIAALVEQVRAVADEITLVEDLWRLHDFLSAKRHEIDGKYNYSYPMLPFIFADLIKDGWLQLNELNSLHQDKLAKIAALTRL